MTMGLAEQIGSTGGFGAPSQGSTYGYYRQPNGWITVSPCTDTDELKYRREGWTPLKRYGTLDMGSGWAADHPFEALFMQGGATELPVQQIIEMGLLLTPQEVPGCRRALSINHAQHNAGCFATTIIVEFPQLAEVAPERLAPLECRFCGVEKPTVKARDQHESVMHKDEKGDIRTGESLAAALVAGLGPSMRGDGGRGQEQGEYQVVRTSDDARVAQLEQQIEALAAMVAKLSTTPTPRPQQQRVRRTSAEMEAARKSAEARARTQEREASGK